MKLRKASIKIFLTKLFIDYRRNFFLLFVFFKFLTTHIHMCIHTHIFSFMEQNKSPKSIARALSNWIKILTPSYKHLSNTILILY